MTGDRSSHPVRVPSFDDLESLRTEGRAVGYRGIHIYLRYRAILRVLEGMTFHRALVVGAGFGIFDRLLPRGLELQGIDVADEEVAFAADWARRNRPDFTYRRVSLEDAGYVDDSFDVVFLSEVIEHVPEPAVDVLLSEARRVLRPGGVLLLTVPNLLHLRNRVRRLVGRPMVLMDPTHLREYTLTEAESVAQGTGLAVERFAPAVLYFPAERRVAQVIRPESPLRDAVIRRFPQVASHFVFVLRKSRG